MLKPLTSDHRRLAALCSWWFASGCFDGDFAQGLPCKSHDDCGPQLKCIDGLCGGPGVRSLCGNGLTDVGEECDDGNSNDGDACTPACRLPVCGDGFLASGEICDDGNAIETDDCTTGCTWPALTMTSDLDILLVIDNSGSMASLQAQLVDAMTPFITELEAGSQFDFRLGFTTTDNGNPWCPPGATTPESGHLVLSPCTSRLGDFLFNSGTVDAQEVACTSICAPESIDWEIRPTPTDLDPNLMARPWLERIDGQSNLPEDVPLSEAIRCFLPQGINGCGFEQPLESMYQTLQLAQDPVMPEYGFVRDSARLALIFLTDEEDCSYNPAWDTIFSSEGTKTFWEDPVSPFPTSAICWNAGVECQGDPNGYDSCDPRDKDVDGNPTSDPERAVIYPMSRYLDFMQELAQTKALDIDRKVIVSLIAAVGIDGQPVYADAADPEFQYAFGIGPGCSLPGVGEGVQPVPTGVPPVRLRVFSESVSPGNMHSICAGSYQEALSSITDIIRADNAFCYTRCALDGDDSTSSLEPNCVVERLVSGEPPREVGECLRGADGIYVFDSETGEYTMPDAGSDICYALRGDPSHSTTTEADDLSPQCKGIGDELGHDVFQLVISRRQGATDDGAIRIACEPCGSPDASP